MEYILLETFVVVCFIFVTIKLKNLRQASVQCFFYSSRLFNVETVLKAKYYDAILKKMHTCEVIPIGDVVWKKCI